MPWIAVSFITRLYHHLFHFVYKHKYNLHVHHKHEFLLLLLHASVTDNPKRTYDHIICYTLTHAGTASRTHDRTQQRTGVLLVN